LEAVTQEQIDTQFDVNFKGVFFAIQKAAPLLAKGGSIVVTTSLLNEVGAPGLSILSATRRPGMAAAFSIPSHRLLCQLRVFETESEAASLPFYRSDPPK
jgi:NAD(P)-dependent dehydrogenase (short-subunit alcohol dehydrogenase family)